MFTSIAVLLDSLSVIMAALLSWKLLSPDNAQFSLYVALTAAAVLIYVWVSSLTRVYQSYRAISDFDWLAKVSLSWLVSTVVVLSILWAFKLSEDFSRLWLASWVFIGLLLTIVWRSLAYQLLIRLRARGYDQKRILVVGAGKLGKRLISTVKQNRASGFEIQALFDDNPLIWHDDVDGVPILPLQQLTEWLSSHSVDEVWFALPLRAEERLHQILYELQNTTVNLRYVPNLSSLRLLNHAPREVLGFSMLDLSVSPMSELGNRAVKWLEDKILATLILLLISPLMLLIALVIKLTSVGPVFYKQKRHGWNGQIFEIYKFRSMVVHSEPEGSLTQAKQGDARITTFGRLLRRTSLDELPQFLNVIKGDMSIVGPRPHALVHNDHYGKLIEGYMRRHKMKPGITGWAQVHGFRGETDTIDKMQNRVEHDLWYIEHWSLWLDLKIILLTLINGFINKNAR